MPAPYQYPQPPQPRPGPYHQPGPYQGPYQPGPHQGPYPPYSTYRPPVASSPLRQPWAIALIALVAITVLAGVLIAAGAAAGNGAAGGTATRDGRTGPVGGQPIPGGGDTGNCPGGSLEGCYTEAQMPTFLRQAITFVHGFSADRHSRMPNPAGYQLIAPGDEARSPCGSLDAMTYAYCPADDRIYIGQKQLWQFYSGIGDAAAVVGLAHEYGHHMQRIAGVPNDRSSSSQIRQENQADCIAGAFVGWAEEKGFLEDGDTQDIEGLVAAIASSEDDPGRDHGTLSERAASMSTGIRDGLPGCSAFYPGTPVH